MKRAFETAEPIHFMCAFQASTIICVASAHCIYRQFGFVVFFDRQIHHISYEA